MQYCECSTYGPAAPTRLEHSFPECVFLVIRLLTNFIRHFLNKTGRDLPPPPIVCRLSRQCSSVVSVRLVSVSLAVEQSLWLYRCAVECRCRCQPPPWSLEMNPWRCPPPSPRLPLTRTLRGRGMKFRLVFFFCVFVCGKFVFVWLFEWIVVW